MRYLKRHELLSIGLGLLISAYHQGLLAQGEDNLQMASPDEDTLTITILYDNNPYDPILTSAWGFAALVEYCGQTLLMDTGGKGEILLGNMSCLDLNPLRIEHVFLSHAHGDHTGGLKNLLATGARPTVYLLSSFPALFKRQLAELTTVIETDQNQILGKRLFTTGDMDGQVHEQTLVIESEHGLVIVTGCAHPGIVPIVARARASFGDPVHLVMGGFHLRDKSETEIAAILAEFRQLGVKWVAPCHCTGDRAIAMFAAEYRDNYIQAGVGKIIRIKP
ncbi:MBL fold metallo-hydrolase [Candidatus Neomarinimicrobiota bacterium]